MPSQLITRMVLNSLHFSGLSNLSNRHLRGLGAILMLHRVEADATHVFKPNSHLSVTPEFLNLLLANISKSIFEFVSMDEAYDRIGNGTKTQGNSRPFLAITLDDGYRDNLENAVPLFRKYRVPYTIYIAPGLVDGRASLWWEDLEKLVAINDRIDLDTKDGRVEIVADTLESKRQAFEKLLGYFGSELDEYEQRRQINDLCWLRKVDVQKHRANSIMTWKELKALAADPLCTLGAHTIGHYAVARLSGEDARFEMEESARLVEVETGERPDHFAYPYGYPAAAGPRDFELAAQCGFKTAVTTRHGVVYSEHADHLTALPRISVNGNFQKYSYIKTMLSGATTRIYNRGSRLNVA